MLSEVFKKGGPLQFDLMNTDIIIIGDRIFSSPWVSCLDFVQSGGDKSRQLYPSCQHDCPSSGCFRRDSIHEVHLYWLSALLCSSRFWCRNGPCSDLVPRTMRSLHLQFYINPLCSLTTHQWFQFFTVHSRSPLIPWVTCNLCMYSNQLCSPHNSYRGLKHTSAGFIFNWFLFQSHGCTYSRFFWLSYFTARGCIACSPYGCSSPPLHQYPVWEYTLRWRVYHIKIFQPWLHGHCRRWTVHCRSRGRGIPIPHPKGR